MSLRSALIWYGVGTVLVAVFIGTSAGLSNSPVIGTLLPLVFSLLGGASGLYLARADLDDPSFARRTKIVGVYMLVVAIALAAGSAYGITLRMGLGFRAFLPSWSGGADPAGEFRVLDSGEGFLDPTLALELGALRTRLRALGFTRQEQQRVLEAAKAELSEITPDLELARKIRAAALAARRIGDLATSGFQAADDDERRKAEGIWGRMEEVANDLDYYAKLLDEGAGFNLHNLTAGVRYWNREVGQIEVMLGPQGDRGKPQHFLGQVQFRERARDLKKALDELDEKLRRHRRRDWMTGTNLTEKIDKLIARAEDRSAKGSDGGRRQPYFTVDP